ncbi:hypothetical protein [Caulobacter segnis]|uniref:hypothetical protein n=1 Tax=Caulobacter segnis TaxID=88688 RepID=UPI0012EE36D6|nr:hypothetical protein [Caulobacter segnis]
MALNQDPASTPSQAGHARQASPAPQAEASPASRAPSIRCPWSSIAAGVLLLAIWCGALLLGGRAAQHVSRAASGQSLTAMVANALGLRPYPYD